MELSEYPVDFSGFDVEILSRSGNFLVASAPMDQLRELAGLPQVLRLEGPSQAAHSLDLSVPNVRADKIWEEPTLGWDKGEGVVAGMVDSGINLQHEAFLDDAGNTRIKYVWDMTGAGGGSPPEEDVCGYWDVNGDWVSESCDGVECKPKQISEGTCQERDIEKPGVMPHGTAVMGTLAGNWFHCSQDVEEKCRGVAPLADIIAVKTPEEFTTVDVAEGTAYIFKKTEELNQPAVVNLSVGSHRGPRDGSSVFEQFMTSQIDPEQHPYSPPRIVVASAGNEGLEKDHAEVTLTHVNPSARVYSIMEYKQSASVKRKTHLEGWYTFTGDQEIEVRILRKFFQDPEVLIDWQQFGSSDSVTGPGNKYEVALFNTESTGPARGFVVEIETETQASWQYLIDVRSEGSGAEEDVVVDLWIDPLATTVGTDGEPLFYFEDESVSPAKTLTPPCTADNVICVSSYNTRCPSGLCNEPLGGNLGNDEVETFSAFSSRGPRRDGALKPEVGAPGQALIVPYSPGETSYRSYAVGTSFSSPHVAGTMALLLRNRPDLSYDELIQSFGGTARSWEISETEWESQTTGYRGVGKLDAYALVKLLSTLPIPPRGLKAWVVEENRVKLSWDASQSENVVSYNIYYDGGSGKMDYGNAIGSVPSGTLSWVTPFALTRGTYRFGVRAVNAEGDEDRNTYVVTVNFSPPLFGGSGDDDLCFIASAAFRDAGAPQVDRLRELRDRFLLPYAWGRALVDHYYRLSPPVAEWLKGHRRISAGVRAALMPAVGCAELLVHRTFTARILMVCMIIFLAGVLWYKKRTKFRGERGF